LGQGERNQLSVSGVAGANGVLFKMLLPPAKTFALALFAALGLGATSAAAGDMTGTWRVKAKVETFAFELSCNLIQTGEKLTGVCTDMATNDPQHKPQGSHKLTSGEVVGDRIHFTYKTHFLLIPFTCTYTGKISSDGFSGEAEAPGHKGTFTAVRV
jgi:hypothetical protein